MGRRTAMVGDVKIEGSSLTDDAEFTVNVIQDTTSSQAIGQVWKTKHALGKEWSGHVSAFYNPDDAVQAALLTASKSTTYDDLHMSAISLYDNASAYFTGSCIISNVTITKSMGSPDKLDFDFEGIGAIAYS